MILMEGWGVIEGGWGGRGPQGRKRPSQRVLNDLKRTRLSGRHLIWLLPHLLPTLLSESCLSFSVFLCVEQTLYVGQGGGGVRAKSYDGEKALSAINH
jgi:hypothetical protein